MSHEASPHLQHHFDTEEQQFDAGKLGMWLFLATEILLFGGMFVAYAIYRANHPEIFIYAHQFLDKILGGTNTVILLCSSLTMAWAVRASQLGQQRLLVVLLSLTLLGGFGFMGIKYLEYKAKWEHGLLPGTHFVPHEEGGHAATPPSAPSAPAATISPSAEGPSGRARHDAGDGAGHGERPSNTQIFFGIYFLMTGLHGIHVLIGMGAITWLLVRSLKGQFGPAYFTPVDFVGLYWHLVDLIWIFLFPLLYLVS
jgi:cytochrome c oxidase subunit 3